jgi:hypothetical protein
VLAPILSTQVKQAATITKSVPVASAVADGICANPAVRVARPGRIQVSVNLKPSTVSKRGNLF